MKGLTTFCLFQIEYLFLNSNLFCFVVITLILKMVKYNISYINQAVDILGTTL